ncbi:hypothetical protein WJX84_003884 [Apatococcus fuscideae]|uniref:Transmembrane protein 53 n=1 Tax=Apatococcus fuscideae TaxID=2026836 RepID=A0AAW1TIA0_9CHLO
MACMPQDTAVVVLFGWLGARPKYLQKYSQQIRVLKAQHGQQPMIYQCFSDAGFIYMTKVLQAAMRLAETPPEDQSEALSEGKLRDQLQPSGIIFDSAPAVLNSVIATRGLISSTLNEPVLGLQERHPLLYRVVLQMAEMLLGLPYVQRHIQQIWQFWEVRAPLCRHLYLYSDADAIIDDSSVEDFAGAQARRGVQVKMHKWKGSGHCEHSRMYPQKYSEQLAAFSDLVLRKP